LGVERWALGIGAPRGSRVAVARRHLHSPFCARTSLRRCPSALRNRAMVCRERANSPARAALNAPRTALNAQPTGLNARRTPPMTPALNRSGRTRTLGRRSLRQNIVAEPRIDPLQSVAGCPRFPQWLGVPGFPQFSKFVEGAIDIPAPARCGREGAIL
jgi:hypothetical protein